MGSSNIMAAQGTLYSVHSFLYMPASIFIGTTALYLRSKSGSYGTRNTKCWVEVTKWTGDFHLLFN